MALPSTLFALATLYAGHRIQLCFREPSSRKVFTSSESPLPWVAVSPLAMILARTAILGTCAYHALLSLSLSPATPNTLLHNICPQPKHLDAQLFEWTTISGALLVLLYAGSYIRFQAYAQLGANFTYRLAKPDGLVTEGLYAYVRHPSYTGLFVVLVAMHFLFLRQRGLLSCFGPEWLTTDERVGYVAPVANLCGFVWGFMVPRVRDEERMMEKEFGQVWRDYCKGTKKFVPFVV